VNNEVFGAIQDAISEVVQSVGRATTRIKDSINATSLLQHAENLGNGMVYMIL